MDHVHPEDLAKCRLPTFENGVDQPKGVPTNVPPELQRTNTSSVNSSSGSSESTEKGVNSSDSSPVTQQPSSRKLAELASTGILKVARESDGRPSYSTEVRLKSKDGEYRWHLVRVLLAEPLLQSVNEEETWYGTCTDINDHKTLERNLKENMDEKTRFLSNMSHEIRTPLNGITGMVNFLIDSSLTAEQMEHVNIIRASTEGLRGLINDILDLSKAEAGMIQLSFDWMYVRALIEEVNDLTSAMAIDKGLELNYIVEEVLLNVIGNAIKFTEQGEVFVRCSAMKKDNEELAENERLIKFEIIDTGRGFTEKEAEHLFKRFSQIDGSSTRQHGGTGLGLVISRQLAQLHGGDMSAKGVPGKGSTFTFYIKTTLPSKDDQPPLPPPPTPGASNIPILPNSPGPATTHMSSLTKMHTHPARLEGQAKPSPRAIMELTQSPMPLDSPEHGRESPSSVSSEPSIRSTARTDSLKSERSSASSYAPDPAFTTGSPMKLAMPSDASKAPASDSAVMTVPPSEFLKAPSVSPNITPGGSLAPPPMYSILVVCPLKYSREATVQHIDKTLPKNVPHQITARERVDECHEMLGGDDPVIFSHVVVVLQDVDEIISLMDQVLKSEKHSATTMVIITDLSQRRTIMEQAPGYDYEKLNEERRLRFVFKPLKPSRFAVIFDPQKEREMSTDRNQDNAQQVALTQKQVFEELANRLGDKDKRVLLVEDNKVNQMVR
jgi:signal transduction histidine kinase